MEDSTLMSHSKTFLERLLNSPCMPVQSFLKKYNLDYLLSLLDRNKIILLEKTYPAKSHGLDLFEFVRYFLNFVDHSEEQTLFLTISIIELYKEISVINGIITKLKLQHITDFLCDKVILQKGAQHNLKNKFLVPQQKETLSLKHLQLNPPIIYGRCNEFNIKLSKSEIKTDRIRHLGIIKTANYIPSLNQIFSLDSLADHINIYDKNCKFLSKIVPSVSKFKRDIIILSMVYSKKQKRLGAVLKDFSLVFWDEIDHFTFQKTFSSTDYCSEMQTNIWFLEYQNLWLTSDRSGNVYVWDLDLEKPCHSINLKLKSKVNDLCQISHLDLIAIVQQNLLNENDFTKPIQNESKIIIYSIAKSMIINQIEVYESRGGVHTLQFSASFQVLMASGFQTKINIFEIHPTYLDATLRGKLVGHQSLVTSFISIQNTPIVVSADDRQKIKIWDIRNFECSQTLDLQGKVGLAKIVSMIQAGKLIILGSRIYLLQFQEKNEISNRLKNNQQITPIKIEYDHILQLLIVFTKKDLRVYDIHTGATKYIYSGLLPAQEEIYCCKYIPLQRKFMIGTQQGDIKIFTFQNGTLISTTKTHSDQVSLIHYDIQNKLIISAGQDSQIFVQKETQKGFEKIKTISDNFHKSEINIMEVSVRHNMICVASYTDSSIHFWDYEFGRLLATIILKDTTPSAISIINCLSLLIITDISGKITGVTFCRSNHTLSFKLIFRYQMKVEEITKGNYFSHLSSFSSEYKLIAGTTHGKIFHFKLDQKTFIIQPSTNQKMDKLYNSNCKKMFNNVFRQSKESFIKESSKNLPKFEISNQFYDILQYEETEKAFAVNHNRNMRDNNNKIKIEHKKSQTLSLVFVVNAHHNQPITFLNFFDFNKKYLISAGKHIKIWQENKMICQLNVNFPLPYQWNLKFDIYEQYSEKLGFALQVNQAIFKRFSQDISISETSRLRIDRFLKKIMSDQTFLTYHDDNILEGETKKKQCIQFYLGKNPTISLKSMQIRRRMRMLQRELTLDQKQLEQERKRLVEQSQLKAEKFQQKCQLMQFFNLTQPQIIKSDQEVKIDKNLSQFYNKLNNYLIKLKQVDAPTLAQEPPIVRPITQVKSGKRLNTTTSVETSHQKFIQCYLQRTQSSENYQQQKKLARPLKKKSRLQTMLLDMQARKIQVKIKDEKKKRLQTEVNKKISLKERQSICDLKLIIQQLKRKDSVKWIKMNQNRKLKDKKMETFQN